MDPTAPSHHQQARLFTRTEEIESSALDISDIKEAAELAPLMLRLMFAKHAAARARMLQGSPLLKTYYFRKGWIRPKLAPKARKAAPQRKGRTA